MPDSYQELALFSGIAQWWATVNMVSVIPNQADGTPSIFRRQARTSPATTFPYCVFDPIALTPNFWSNTSTHRQAVLQFRVWATDEDAALAAIDAIAGALDDYPIPLPAGQGEVYATDRGRSSEGSMDNQGINVFWALADFRVRRRITRTKAQF